MRLEPTEIRLLHLATKFADPGGVDGVVGEDPFLGDLPKPIDVERLLDLGNEERRRHRGIVVADRPEQKILERDVLEHATEDVEDLATEGGASDLQLRQQSLVDVTLAGVASQQVPEVTDLLLADAVDATEPLLQSVRVPRQVVVDHQVGPLQVDALAGGIGRDQDLDLGLVLESLLGAASHFATHAPGDGDHRFVLAKQGSELGAEVVQGVLVLGEDDQLAKAAILVMHDVLLQDLLQLGPLRIAFAPPNPPGELLQTCELADFGFEFLHGPGGRCLVDHLVLEIFELVAQGIIRIREQIERRLVDRELPRRRDLPTASDFPHLPRLRLEPILPTPKRLVDRSGAGGESTLQDGEREADGALATAIEGFRPVVLLADVIGDFGVELGLVFRELIPGDVGPSLGEEFRPIEPVELLLHPPQHEVGGIGDVHAVPGPALEAIAVEQGEEEFEVLLLAVVRRRRHEQQIPGGRGDEFAELVSLGLLLLTTEPVGGHLVGLVDDDQIPVGLLEQFLDVLVSSELVDAGDDLVVFQEPVPTRRRLESLVGEDLEAEVELLAKLVLPLFPQTAGGDDQTPLQITADLELLDEEPGHDRLAGTRIVGKQESERLLLQHSVVHRE